MGDTPPPGRPNAQPWLAGAAVVAAIVAVVAVVAMPPDDDDRGDLFGDDINPLPDEIVERYRA